MIFPTPDFVADLSKTLARLLPVNYSAYIKSGRWKKKADRVKERAGWRCMACNRPRGYVQLEAHHRTYERLGYEIPEDLICLCRDCHQAVTDVRRYKLHARPL